MYRLLVRSVLRRHLRSVLALGLGCGLAVGVGLWGLAAARRTASSYERYLEAAEASDVSFNVNSFERAFTFEDQSAVAEQVRRLPGVVDDASYIGLEAMRLSEDEDRQLTPLEFVGSLDGRFLDQDRVALVDGRLPRADRPDEVLVNVEAATARSLEVGRTVSIDVADADSFEEGAIRFIGRFDAQVVGIAVFPDDVLSDEYDRLGRLLLTPAATRMWMAEAGTYVWHGLRLTDPSEAPTVVAAYGAIAGEGAFVNSRITADQADDVQRALRPVVGALVVFGVTALLVGLVLAAIAAARLAHDWPDRPILDALGLPPSTARLLSATPGLVAGAVAGVVSAIAAFALSPLSPVGAMRAVEPTPGADLDGVVLPLGALAVFVLLPLAGLLAVRPPTTRTAEAGPSTTRRFGPRLVGALPPAAALGVRRGLGRPGTGAPTRMAIGGIAIALAAIVGSLTFGAGIGVLLDEPERHGWATDLAVVAGSGYDTIDPARAAGLVEGDPRVRGLAVAGYAGVELGGELVPATAIEAVRGSPPLTLLGGRAPTDSQEVALGRRTADRLGVEVDDELQGPRGRLRVTGIVAFPALGQATTSHPGMGEGALFTFEGLGKDEAQPSIAFVDLADGVVAASVGRELGDVLAGASDGGFTEVYPLLHPAELDGAEDASGTVGAIAAVVGIAAIVALAAVVLASVRARARELAILRTIGLTPADLRRSVRWQAATLGVTSVLIGAPLGIVAGRIVWRAFARTLGVDPSPTVPLLLVGAVAVAAGLVAVVVAQPAAWRAGGAPVAPALRPE